MSGDRLTLALAQGLCALPDGPVVVWGARGDTDLSALPRDRTVPVVTFKPDSDALAGRGFAPVTAAPSRAGLGVVFLPRARDMARAMLAEAVGVSAGPVIVDGQKTDGIEAILRALRTRGDLSPPLSKAHGKLAVLGPGADLSDWADPGPQEIAGGFVTRAGVFSADAPDPGSVLLAAALPARLGPAVADLGAGWGYLSRAVLARHGVATLDCVEAELRALDCARTNLPDPRVRFHWADATAWGAAQSMDTVVANPPFHAARAADPELGRAFIRRAARLLKPGGQLWLVANRQLPYEKALADAFGEHAEIGGDRSFKLLRASRPKGVKSR